MKHTIITLLMLASLGTIHAEEWSLDSCITYAIEHNLTIKSQDIEQMGGEPVSYTHLTLPTNSLV